MRKLLLQTILLIILTTSSFYVTAQTGKQQSNGATEKFVVVNGHKMHYQTGGAGPATVIFENGHGESLSSWDNIFPQVAKFAKVLRYDRMGNGSSEQTTQPRSFKQIATELHTLLQQASISPPYILVGHSMGGAIIRAFTFLYKDETKGLVLIDPFSEFMSNGMSEELKQQYVKTGDSVMRANVLTSNEMAEWDHTKEEFLKGASEINSFGDIPDVPLAMLVAGKSRFVNWEKNLVDLYESQNA